MSDRPVWLSSTALLVRTGCTVVTEKKCWDMQVSNVSATLIHNNKQQEQTGGPKSKLCNFYVAAFLLTEQPKHFSKGRSEMD